MTLTLDAASKLRLRTGSFRLPTWRRPIFDSGFLWISVAEETAGGHAFDNWQLTGLRSGNWSATRTMTATRSRWGSRNGETQHVCSRLRFALGADRCGGGLVPLPRRYFPAIGCSLPGFYTFWNTSTRFPNNCGFLANPRAFAVSACDHRPLLIIHPHVVSIPALSPPLLPIFRPSVLCYQVQSPRL